MSDVREKPIYVLPADMRGPQGNAFFMMADALGILRRSGYTSEERQVIQNDMMAGDYAHFLDTLFTYFRVVRYTEIEPVERREIDDLR